MSSDQFGGLVRTVLSALAGFLPAFNPDLLNAIIGGVVIISVGLWSYYTNRPSQLSAPVERATAP